MTALDKYCLSDKTKYLDRIDSRTKNILVDYSFRCLHQKIGMQDRAKDILKHYKLIQTIPETEYVVYTGEDMKNPIHQLERSGVTTIPVYSKTELQAIQKKFIKVLRKFPEYRRTPDNPDLDGAGNSIVYVLGGFAALGNPASFHNELVRNIRIKTAEQVKINLIRPLILRKLNKKLRKSRMEVLYDRMMYRMAGMKPTAESWHRDVMSPGSIQPDDEIYGGWVNIDSKPQYFSCIPGSHLGIKQYDLKSGFATVPKSDVAKVSKHKKKFVVPPGHCIIFPQYILHEVVGTVTRYNMMRLFTGWRTTLSKTSLHGDEATELIMENQSVPPIPGGMIPPMFACNHGSYFLRKQFKPNPKVNTKVNLIEWSKNTFLPKLLVQKKDYKIVERHLKSLRHYGLRMYTPYTADERALYRPFRVTTR